MCLGLGLVLVAVRAEGQCVTAWEAPDFKDPTLFYTEPNSAVSNPHGLAIGYVVGYGDAGVGAPDGHPDVVVANKSTRTVTIVANTRNWSDPNNGLYRLTPIRLGDPNDANDAPYAVDLAVRCESVARPPSAGFSPR